MILVMPMAGRGSRFVNKGYSLPKYLVEVKGKTLLEHSLSSLPLDLVTHTVFVALEDQVRAYNLENIFEKILRPNSFSIVAIPEVTRGQAETVLQAESFIQPDLDLIIFNIDTHFQSRTLGPLLRSESRHDGVLGAFEARDSKWSFAKTDEHGFVIETAEKIPISHWALTGLYHFRRGSDFVRVAKRHLHQGITSQNEYYVAPMYNDLIRSGKKIVLDPVETLIPLGTPEDVEAYEKS